MNTTTQLALNLDSGRFDTKIRALQGFQPEFFSGSLIDTKIILNESLGQHDQNAASCTQIGPQTRKLSLIEVLTLRVCVSLNGHAYIGLYLTHKCQKHFWKGKKTNFSAHAHSKLHCQKRQVEKVI